MRQAILWPLFAQVALVLFVWIRLYQTRIGEIRSRGIDPQTLTTRQSSAEVLKDTAAADNFSNLFEVPVLFFVVCLALAVTDLVTAPQVALAWAFVVLRIAHSYVHLTYNRVIHRFGLYMISTLCVSAMWVLFAISLLGQH